VNEQLSEYNKEGVRTGLQTFRTRPYLGCQTVANLSRYVPVDKYIEAVVSIRNGIFML